MYVSGYLWMYKGTYAFMYVNLDSSEYIYIQYKHEHLYGGMHVWLRAE